MSDWKAIWCFITFRHRGHIVWVKPGDVRWMCNNCGQVIR